MQKPLVFEHPLNERIRSFLRLEFLFNQIVHFASSPTNWHCRDLIYALHQVLEILARSDLKSELIKELEGQSKRLESLQNTPHVDEKSLNRVLSDLNQLCSRLHALKQPFGHGLRQNEFLCNVRKRISMPGGTCDFDLPGFHLWLERPQQTRQQEIQSWLATLKDLEKGIVLTLGLLRESVIPVAEVAQTGIYMGTLQSSQSVQLLRILVPVEKEIFPEISGGKHRFSIRFMHYENFNERPTQVKEDVQFHLACCQL